MADFRIDGVIAARNKDYLAAITSSTVATKALGREQRKAGRDARTVAIEQRILTRELERQRRQLSALTLQWVGLRKAVLTFGVRTAIAGFAALAASVGSLGGGLVNLTSAIGAASAALGALGTAGLTAMVQGLAVAAMGLKDMRKALFGFGDAADNAYKKLSKPAQGFVDRMKEMRGAFLELRMLAQIGLFTGLEKAAARLPALMGPLKQVIYDTALAMGYLADKVAFVAEKRKGDLEAFGERNALSIQRLGDATISLGSAFLTMFRAADPLIGHLTKRVEVLADAFDKWLAGKRKDGSLGAFFEDAGRALDVWANVLKNVVVTLGNTLRAAFGPAMEMSGAIEDVTANWAKWTGSSRGQRELARFFTASNKVLGAMAELLGQVVVDWAKLTVDGADTAARFWRGLQDHLLPLLMQIADQLNKSLFPRLMDLGRAFADFASEAIDALEPLGVIAGRLAAALAKALEIGTKIVGKFDGMTKLTVALGVGATILAGWAKLRGLIEASLLGLRRMAGLTATDRALFMPAVRQTFAAGGRAERGLPSVGGGGAAAGTGARSYGLSGGGNGQSMAVVPALAIGGRSIRFSQTAMDGALTKLKEQTARTSTGFAKISVAAQRVEMALKQQASKVETWQGLGKGMQPVLPGQRMRPGMPIGNAILPPRASRVGPVSGSQMSPSRTFLRLRNTPGGIFFGHVPGVTVAGTQSKALTRTPGGIRVPLLTVSATRVTVGGANVKETPTSGRATRDYRQATSISPPQPRNSATLAGTYAKNYAGMAAAGTVAGLKTAATKVGPILKGGFAFAAVNGILSGLSSQAPTIGQKLADVVSGATFNLIPSFDELSTKRAKELATSLEKTGNLVKQFKGQIVPDSAVKGLEKVHGKVGEFNVKLADGVKKSKAWVDELVRMGDISHADADALKAMIDQQRNAALHFERTGSRAGEFVGTLGSVNDALRLSRNNFADWASSNGKHFEGVKSALAQNMTAIKRDLGAKSAAGKQALANNFRLAAKAVETQMASAGKTTKEGLALVQSYMEKALMVYGLSRKQARSYIKTGGSTTGGPTGKVTNGQAQGAATGALKTLPGPSAGPDRIPLPGLGVIAAPGEQVAVINRHQRRFLDRRLADVGGLPGVFRNVNKRHNAPLAPMQGGGIVALGRELQRMGYQVSENPAFGGVHPVHTKGSYHYKGQALDVNADGNPGGEAKWLDRLAKFLAARGWHYLWRVPGHFDHLHVDTAGGVGGMLKALKIKAPELQDGLGVVGDVVSGALKQAAAAATEAGNKLLAKMGMETGGDGGNGAATGNGADLMKRISKQRGWNFADWWALDAHESSHGANLVNPTSTARLRGQFLSMNWGKYGVGSDPRQNPSMTQQIYAMAAYISERYGNPTRAWAAWQSHYPPGWYALGGLVEASAGQPPTQPGTGNTLPSTEPGSATPGLSPKQKEAAAKKKAAEKKAAKKRKEAHPKPQHGPKLPGRVKATPGSHNDRKKRRSPIPKRIRNLKMPAGLNKDIAGFDRIWNALTDKQGSLDNALANMQNTQELSVEEQFVELADWQGAPDLSEFLKRFPEARKYLGDADTLSVPNIAPYEPVGGTRGVGAYVGELDEQLRAQGVMPGGGPTGGGILAHLQTMQKAADDAVTYFNKELPKALLRRKRLRAIWDHKHEMAADAMHAIRRLSAQGVTWSDKVDANEQSIKRYKAWLKTVQEMAVDGPLDDDTKKSRIEAHDMISKLSSENADLRRRKPAPKQVRGKIKHQREILSDARRVMEYIAGSSDKWSTDGGIVKAWQNRIESLRSGVETYTDEGKTLREVTIPGLVIDAGGIINDRTAWMKTNWPPTPPLGQIYDPEVDGVPGDFDGDNAPDVTAIRRRIAEATLTPGLDDDTKAVQELVDLRTKQYEAVKNSTDDNAVINAINALSDAKDQLASLTGEPSGVGGVGGGGEDNRYAEAKAAREELMKQRLSEAQLTNTVLTQQLKTFQSFAPLAQLRMVGAFAHGALAVPETGMALVHQNETIIPAPDGPYYNQAAARARAGGSGAPGPLTVVLHADANLAPLLGKIRAEVRQEAPNAVSRELGRRRRLITVAPGR